MLYSQPRANAVAAPQRARDVEHTRLLHVGRQRHGLPTMFLVRDMHYSLSARLKQIPAPRASAHAQDNYKHTKGPLRNTSTQVPGRRSTQKTRPALDLSNSLSSACNLRWRGARHSRAFAEPAAMLAVQATHLKPPVECRRPFPPALGEKQRRNFHQPNTAFASRECRLSTVTIQRPTSDDWEVRVKEAENEQGRASTIHAAKRIPAWIR